jgi:hypothetical protein
MLDLPYILTHRLLRSIMKRHAELKEQAESLPQGSAERKTLEKRISHLELLNYIDKARYCRI